MDEESLEQVELKVKEVQFGGEPLALTASEDMLNQMVIKWIKF